MFLISVHVRCYDACLGCGQWLCRLWPARVVVVVFILAIGHASVHDPYTSKATQQNTRPRGDSNSASRRIGDRNKRRANTEQIPYTRAASANAPRLSTQTNKAHRERTNHTPYINATPTSHYLQALRYRISSMTHTHSICSPCWRRVTIAT